MLDVTAVADQLTQRWDAQQPLIAHAMLDDMLTTLAAARRSPTVSSAAYTEHVELLLNLYFLLLSKVRGAS